MSAKAKESQARELIAEFDADFKSHPTLVLSSAYMAGVMDLCFAVASDHELSLLKGTALRTVKTVMDSMAKKVPAREIPRETERELVHIDNLIHRFNMNQPAEKVRLVKAELARASHLTHA